MRYRDERRRMRFVNSAVNSSGTQYALIAGLRTETGPERLVIAYSNERSLREFIAATSIIAVGFSSREEAVADSKASLAPAAATSEESMPASVAENTERYQQGFHRSERAEIASVLGRAAEFLVASYRDIASMAAVVLFSTNAISALIRMALGSPV
jgi:hypothetical protein